MYNMKLSILQLCIGYHACCYPFLYLLLSEFFELTFAMLLFSGFCMDSCMHMGDMGVDLVQHISQILSSLWNNKIPFTSLRWYLCSLYILVYSIERSFIKFFLVWEWSFDAIGLVIFLMNNILWILCNCLSWMSSEIGRASCRERVCLYV